MDLPSKVKILLGTKLINGPQKKLVWYFGGNVVHYLVFKSVKNPGQN